MATVLTLVSKDGDERQVDEFILTMSNFLKGASEFEDVDNAYHLMLCNAKHLDWIIEWVDLQKTRFDEGREKVLINNASQEFDDSEKEFMEKLNFYDKLDLFKIVRFLEMECLKDALCTTLADMVRGKKTEEMKNIWKLEGSLPSAHA